MQAIFGRRRPLSSLGPMGQGVAMAAALMADDDLTKEDIKELRDFFNSRF